MSLVSCCIACSSCASAPASPSPIPLETSVSISIPGLLSATVSNSFSTTLQASGGTSPYAWTLVSGTLPPGISLSSGGVLTGTPTAVGDSTVVFKVADSSSPAQTATQNVFFAIIPSGFVTIPVFDEEFSGSALNTSLWNYRTGVRDHCTQDSSAVTVANGYLRLSTYTSSGTNHCGALDTSQSFTHAYGYWEAAVRYQYQTGAQCAWWVQSPTNGKDLSNPQASGVEMDIFEHTAWTNSPTGYDHALHWDGYAAGVGQSLGYNGTFANLNDGTFYVFAIAWTPSGYTFYVDGVVTWTVSSSQAPVSSANEYVILDTELPSATQVLPNGYGVLGSSNNQYLDVDYVRIYPYTSQ